MKKGELIKIIINIDGEQLVAYIEKKLKVVLVDSLEKLRRQDNET